MLALVVEFRLEPAHVDACDAAITENARLSRKLVRTAGST